MASSGGVDKLLSRGHARGDQMWCRCSFCMCCTPPCGIGASSLLECILIQARLASPHVQTHPCGATAAPRPRRPG